MPNSVVSSTEVSVLTQLDGEPIREFEVNKLSQLVKVFVRSYHFQDVQQPEGGKEGTSG